MKLKLQQGQVWQQGEDRLRIVHLERLSVEYMRMDEEASVAGMRIPHHTVTKKEFCRLIKGATLFASADMPGTLPAAE